MDLLATAQTLFLVCLFATGARAYQTFLLLFAVFFFCKHWSEDRSPVFIKQSTVSIYNADYIQRVPVQTKISYRRENLVDSVNSSGQVPLVAALNAAR